MTARSDRPLALMRELHLTEMRVRQLEKAGMPVDDVTAARQWRATNIRSAAKRDALANPSPTHAQSDCIRQSVTASAGRGNAILNNSRHIEEALAGLTDRELRALKITSNEVPQGAPGLMAWIEGACDWELNRRRGVNRYTLEALEAAIDPNENVGTEAAYAMRAFFAGGDQDNAVLSLFDALVESLDRRRLWGER